MRESHELLPGTIIMAISGGGFHRKIVYGVTNGRVIFKVNNIHQHGHEFKGTVTHEVLDLSGMQSEVLLQGLRVGDIMQSHLQLDGLPSGSVIEPTAPGAVGQYKKVDSLKWSRMGEAVASKYDSFHFDPALKYKWIR